MKYYNPCIKHTCHTVVYAQQKLYSSQTREQYTVQPVCHLVS